MQFKLDPRLARLLGVHTQTRPVIITSLWQYIKTHKLQDAHEREYINCDKYLNQVIHSENTSCLHVNLTWQLLFSRRPTTRFPELTSFNRSGGPQVNNRVAMKQAIWMVILQTGKIQIICPKKVLYGEFTSNIGAIFKFQKIKGCTRSMVWYSYNILALKQILSWIQPNSKVKFLCNRLYCIWNCCFVCMLVAVYLSLGSGSRINISFWGKNKFKQVRSGHLATLPLAPWTGRYGWKYYLP